MLLNKLPCLDKGYVALVSSMNDSNHLKDIGTEFFGVTAINPKTLNIGYMTLAVKCPLFIHTHLAQFEFNIITTKPSKDVEAYIPNPGEIGSKDSEVNRVIADDINRTIEALFINPKAYQADGCDRFISHLIMPISTYTTILVTGRYDQWSKFINQTGLPAPIESYRLMVDQIFKAEWK